MQRASAVLARRAQRHVSDIDSSVGGNGGGSGGGGEEDTAVGDGVDDDDQADSGDDAQESRLKPVVEGGERDINQRWWDRVPYRLPNGNMALDLHRFRLRTMELPQGVIVCMFQHAHRQTSQTGCCDQLCVMCDCCSCSLVCVRWSCRKVLPMSSSCAPTRTAFG